MYYKIKARENEFFDVFPVEAVQYPAHNSSYGGRHCQTTWNRPREYGSNQDFNVIVS